MKENSNTLEERKYCVYAHWYSTELGHVRYIGWSGIGADKRLLGHLRDERKYRKTGWYKGCNTYKCSSIGVLLAAGGHVIPAVLEHCSTKAEARLRERHWIQYYKALGHKLTNGTSGGDGCPDIVWTDEHKKRRSAATKKRFEDMTAAERAEWAENCRTVQANMSKEAKAQKSTKIKAAKTGKKLGPLSQAHYSAIMAGRAGMSLEATAQMHTNRMAGLAAMSEKAEEQRRTKISVALKGKPSPLKGGPSWKKGIKTGKPAWNSGKQTGKLSSTSLAKRRTRIQQRAAEKGGNALA